MRSLKLNLKSEDADDLVNATMTELSILLLFTIGFLAYFVGETLSNIASGTKNFVFLNTNQRSFANVRACAF